MRRASRAGEVRPSALHYSAGAGVFALDLEAFPVELIEVKLSLDRTAIGQAIAGRHMFRRQYGTSPGRSTILCRVTDSALAWVCEQESIDVEELT